MSTTDYNPGPVARLLGKAAYEAGRLRPLLPTYSHLLVSAIFPIYTGAHASLSRPSSAAKPEKKERKPKDGDDEDSDSEDDDLVVQKMEGLTPSDAIMFPLMAGITLASLYFIIKWMKDPALLNKILRYYFSQMGLFFSIRFLKDFFSVSRSFVFPSQYVYRGSTWKVNMKKQQFEAVSSTSTSSSEQKHQIEYSPFPGVLSRFHFSKSILKRLWSFREFLYAKATLRFHVKSFFTLKSPVDVLDGLSTIISAALVIYSLMTPSPWYLTNFFGFAFCYGSLQFMSPTTFWTGSLILSSLFFYDIYFVFFTPLMVTVATKLDVPIKLLFPRPPAPGAAPDAISLAMLGLGDIVIPGMMIGLALRFDLHMHYLRRQTLVAQQDGQKPEVKKVKYVRATGQWGERYWSPSSSESSEEVAATRFPKPYFTASVVGYLIGMMTTLAVMQIAEHAQPALLYLVPGVLSSLWGTALVRGEIKHMWNFTEEEEEEEQEGEKVTEKEPEEGVLDTLRSFIGLKSSKASADSSKKQLTTTSSNESTTTAKPASDQQQKKPKQDMSRKLIDFSITLPRPKTSSEKSEPATIEASKEASSPAVADDKSSFTFVHSGSAESFANASGSNITAGTEPPTKRARAV